ncbi:unnamed protein product [Ectocarpus sp. CCAP 1310/34]|nr:unnamed protein product [Ectocarpus sp. CCAP 1310/34]
MALKLRDKSLATILATLAHRGGEAEVTPPREKRPRDCQHAAESTGDAPPGKRGGARPGAGRPKGSYGRNRLRQAAQQLNGYLERGQLQCAQMVSRDLPGAMLDAVKEAHQQEVVYRPAFLKRQSNRGLGRKEALRKLAKHQSQLQKEAAASAACRSGWERGQGCLRAVIKECQSAIAVTSAGLNESVLVSHSQAGSLQFKALARKGLYHKLLRGVSKRQAFEETAEFFEVASSTLREWELSYRTKGHIQVDQRGKHERRWILSLDEGLLVMVRQWIRVNSIKNGEPNMTAEGFREYLNKDVLPQSGLYFDGRDREDVLAYRVEKYLPAYFEHRDYMEIWIEATSDEARSWEVQVQEQDRQEDGRVWVWVHAFKETLSELPQHLRERVTSKKTYSDGRRAILCYHDECIYRANDGQRFAWVPPNYHAFKRKGDSQGIMISGTIVDNVGVEYGKSMDGYRTGAKMVEHMADVLDLLAVKHPMHKPICFFDWSSCHDCVEDGAPSATRMNAGYGGVRKGKQLAAQDATTLLADTPKLKQGTVQYLTFQGESLFCDVGAEDYIGKLKGLKQVLFERGLWNADMSMKGIKKGQQKYDPALCMPVGLGTQEDLASVEPSLVVFVKRREGVAIILPKYHCEINPIELVWGRSKYWVRQHCKTVANFNGVYRDGLQGTEAVQKRDTFKSHRKPAPSEYINPK